MALNEKTSLARKLAPEEIRRGQYVAALAFFTELLPFWCDEVAWRDVQPRRIQWLPSEEPTPLKVKGVCLPFVQVKSPCGKLRTLDVRRYQLAELDPAFGERVFRFRRKRSKQRRVKRRTHRSANDRK